MKDSILNLKHKRKRSQSSESDSSETSSKSDGSEHISKVQRTKSPERIVISSDSESSLIEMKNLRKRRKYKHSDVENFHVNHDGDNMKRHRHKCRHHHHRHHHRHHRLEYNREREEKSHRKTCSKHRIAQEAVRVKEEPESDDERIRESRSSHRRIEKRRDRSNDDEYIRHEQLPETSTGNRERRADRREKSFHRRVGNDDRNERNSDERQIERKRNTESESRKEGSNKSEEKKNGRQGRRNRWGNDEVNLADTNRPIKQEASDGEHEWGKKAYTGKDEKKIVPGPKDKPNFGLSGKLTEDTNMYNGIVIKYSEPPEARKPKRRWRFYPFKGDEGLPTLYIHRQSCYLIGRERKVADIPVDHPSCSKQHAALQYRLVPFERVDGTIGKRVRPYIIDLESANGTYVNNVKIEPRTYVELLEKDVVKFGYSSREYVLLHEQSKDDELDDDIKGGDD